ncbi:copper transporter [Trebonia kvetii]|uniref:copper transporter n=1 Tax=Trebonia kvetii TaxID=2480626 RepID=UPI0016529BD9|nr:copper transporter [Trebonia kvetii]
MIDFRYHLVSIVAVFLALAIGIVLGSTELQGHTIDVLRSSSNSLTNQLNAVRADRDRYQTLSGASDSFLTAAEPKLLDGTLSGQRLVIVTEPGAPSAVVNGIKQAAGTAGATVTGTVALQPKFNDLSGTTRSSLNAINAQFASHDSTVLDPAADSQTMYQQQAAQLIATAILNQSAGQAGLAVADAQGLLSAYAQAGYLTISGAPTNRATLAVIVTSASAPTAAASDPGNQVLLAVAAEFATQSAATLVAGSVAASSQQGNAMAVLRSSSVSGEVSSVDNADTVLGQIVTMWALGDQLAGLKPNSYGISGASAVGPVTPVASTEPTVSQSPTATSTPKASNTPTGKPTKTVKKS